MYRVSCKIVKTNPKWANSKLMNFVLYQKERVYKNEIVYATILVILVSYKEKD